MQNLEQILKRGMINTDRPLLEDFLYPIAAAYHGVDLRQDTDGQKPQAQRARKALNSIGYVARVLSDIDNDSDHTTAMHYLVLWGQVDLLKQIQQKVSGPSGGKNLLPEAGILVNLRNRDGKTPLHLAYRLGNQEVIDILKAMGADEAAEDIYHQTPSACDSRKPGPVYLLANGAAMFSAPKMLPGEPIEPPAKKLYYTQEQIEEGGNKGGYNSKGLKVHTMYQCSMTHVLMVDPVKAADGRYYERDAIEGWFLACRDQQRPLTSPVDGSELRHGSLYPAPHLVTLIRSQYGEPQGVKDAAPEAAGPAARA